VPSGYWLGGRERAAVWAASLPIASELLTSRKIAEVPCGRVPTFVAYATKVGTVPSAHYPTKHPKARQIHAAPSGAFHAPQFVPTRTAKPPWPACRCHTLSSFRKRLHSESLDQRPPTNGVYVPSGSPAGTAENSPAIYRWVTAGIGSESRQGRKTMAVRFQFSFAPAGLCLISLRNPRLKPWAIFGGPLRDQIAAFVGLRPRRVGAGILLTSSYELRTLKRHTARALG